MGWTHENELMGRGRFRDRREEVRRRPMESEGAPNYLSAAPAQLDMRRA